MPDNATAERIAPTLDGTVKPTRAERIADAQGAFRAEACAE